MDLTSMPWPWSWSATFSSVVFGCSLLLLVRLIGGLLEPCQLLGRLGVSGL
jgi:hypothetical protein